jgi:hypothetical protein
MEEFVFCNGTLVLLAHAAEVVLTCDHVLMAVPHFTAVVLLATGKPLKIRNR